VSAAYFRVLGVRPILGRDLTAAIKRTRSWENRFAMSGTRMCSPVAPDVLR
jgi:hypothetical protein